MTEPRFLAPSVGCHLHRYHSPLPLVLHAHHVVPLSFTNAAGEPPSRTVPLCPTGHENTHLILRERLNGRRTSWAGVDEKMRALVEEALAWAETVPAPVRSVLRELAP